PFLRAALKGQPSLEKRRRIEGLLDKLPGFDVSDIEIPKGITLESVDDLIQIHWKRLKDADSTTRGMAIQELTILAPYSDKIVPAMTAMLDKKENEWVRRVAAGCLGRVGAQANAAIPSLQAGLGDADANIRNAFQAALDQIANARPVPDKEMGKKRAIL